MLYQNYKGILLFASQVFSWVKLSVFNVETTEQRLNAIMTNDQPRHRSVMATEYNYAEWKKDVLSNALQISSILTETRMMV